MGSLFLLLGCNLSYIVDLFAALHELASASARTLLKLASSVRALLKPYGDTLIQQRGLMLRMRIIVLEIAANCVKFIRNAGKRVRAAVAQTGLSFIECSLFVSKRTAQNECKAGI